MVVAIHHPPRFSEREAEQLAARLYGLIGTARPLPSERDQNFLLTAQDGSAFVLKIANAGEERAILDFQNEALARIKAAFPGEKDRGPGCPELISTLAGESIATVTDSTGTSFMVRLLTYLPGTPLAIARPHSPALLRDLGAFFGRLDQALADFSHPAMDRELKWDFKHAPAVIRDYRSYIVDADRRALVDHFLTRYEQAVLPASADLRQSVIHNDGNDYNILVRSNEAMRLEVAGIIDFGDMVKSYTIGEVAIAAAYAMLDKPDPLAAAAQVVGGYHAAFPLTEQELESLFHFICIRLCMSVTIAAHQQQREPDNAYLGISEGPAWALLTKLVEIHPRFAYYVFRDACGLPPCPQIAALTAWLGTHQADFGRVVEPDLRNEPSLVFDLSVGSLLLGELSDRSDVGAFTDLLFNRMRAAGVEVGIGRYNEARQIYTGEGFRLSGNHGDEWRTTHVAIDLFMPPGSPIFAPLDGTVHSFANNAYDFDYGPTIILQHDIGELGLTFYTLYGHLSLDSLDGLYEGKPVAKGTEIARIGDYPLNGNWPPHLHFQVIVDLLDEACGYNGVAAPSQRAVWLSLCPDPNLILGIPADRFPSPGRSKAEILAVRHRHLGQSLSISYEQPLKIERGYMQYLYDETGRAYLDAVNNVPHVGHNHPRVVKAGQAQMAILNTNTRYLHDLLVEYAERLCATLPEPLRVCFFVCSGSEANELALRLARTYTGRRDLIVLDGAYHGNTGSLIEISPYKFDGPGGAGVPDHVHIALMPDGYRGPYKGNSLETGQQYAAHVGTIIDQARQQGRDIGAFIAESLLGCGGQIVLPDGYLAEAYRYVRAAGGVCIADEVQVGFGRVGSHFWGFELQGVVPDILTLGKPIGNGHPLAAVVTTPEIAAAFANGMEYFNTFGGNPVSCAIGLAVLDVIKDEELQANALAVGTYLLERLAPLKQQFPLVGDVRGAGLYIGLELVLDRKNLTPAPRHATYIANRMKERGILISTDGPLHNILKLKPPLVFSKANADFFVETLSEILAETVLQVDEQSSYSISPADQ